MDKKIQKAINKARNKHHENRTEKVAMRVSPEEKRLIYERFGGPAGLRDFGLGLSSAGAVDFFIDDFRAKLETLEEYKSSKGKE